MKSVLIFPSVFVLIELRGGTVGDDHDETLKVHKSE